MFDLDFSTIGGRAGVRASGLIVLVFALICVAKPAPTLAQPANGPGVSQEAFYRDGGWNDTYSAGQELYEDNCSACHGDEGSGGMGLPLNLQSFLVIADQDYLIKSMQYGRPVRGMPSFEDDLDPADMHAIAAFVKSWQYQPSLELPKGPITGDVKNGQALFKGLCTGCHGIDGMGGPEAGGGHVIGAMSGIGGPALADQGFLKSATDSYIKATLMYGRVGTPMGAYLKGRQGFVELLEQEIDDIITYIRSLQEN